MERSELKDILMAYILEFVDLSDEKLVGIFDETFQKLKLKSC